jgi:hypothetical protein
VGEDLALVEADHPRLVGPDLRDVDLVVAGVAYAWMAAMCRFGSGPLASRPATMSSVTTPAIWAKWVMVGRSWEPWPVTPLWRHSRWRS